LRQNRGATDKFRLLRGTTLNVPDACRIIEDGQIKAGLIGDESRLRRTRTSVCWLSANYWQPGSIYGTVQFTFRWDDIIRGRDVYIGSK
jgi:hypothetical protein